MPDNEANDTATRGHISVYLREDMVEELQERCVQNDMSASEYIRKTLEERWSK